MNTEERSAIARFETWVQTMPRAELGGLLKEYVAESNHSSWEGFSSRDLTGIRRFLYDLMIYHEHAVGEEPFATRTDSINKVP